MEGQILNGHPSQKVMAAHKPEILTHATVAWITAISKEGKVMHRPRRTVGNADKKLHLQSSLYNLVDKSFCGNICTVIFMSVDHGAL
jgi:hypothetical protein